MDKIVGLKCSVKFSKTIRCPYRFLKPKNRRNPSGKGLRLSCVKITGYAIHDYIEWLLPF